MNPSYNQVQTVPGGLFLGGSYAKERMVQTVQNGAAH